MYIYGIRLEFFADIIGTNKDVIFLLKENKKHLEYSLKSNKFRIVQGFIAPNYICKYKKEFCFDILSKGLPFKNDLISFKKDSYDIILNDEISINSKFFKLAKKNDRVLEKRPVWIFKGDSGLGKSYISSYLVEFKSIYETDSSETLPNVIYDDIIVLGNKYNFSEEDIVSRLYGDVEVIKVNFSK